MPPSVRDRGQIGVGGDRFVQANRTGDGYTFIVGLLKLLACRVEQENWISAARFSNLPCCQESNSLAALIDGGYSVFSNRRNQYLVLANQLPQRNTDPEDARSLTVRSHPRIPSALYQLPSQDHFEHRFF